MTRSKSANPLTKKQDLTHLAILLVIALGIGVYLIATTVVITRDGVRYIQLAMKFSSEPQEVIKKIPFGFPFLIFMTHKLVASLSNSSPLFTWIYSAQSITLLCRLLALIPLYFIGKLLVGSKRSFWAILILIILPYPAEFGSDVLRDWPHILFLASGFLFLIWGVKQGKCRMFGATGLAAGLGYIIRPECAQLLIYGALWIFIRLFSPKPGMSRPKLLCALSVLLIGFAIPAAPYMTARGKFLPEKLKTLISSTDPDESEKIQEPDTNSGNDAFTASSMPGKIVKAIGELAGVMSENLMYYFVPALLIGIHFRFRKRSPAAEIERFFVPAFAALNVVMLIALYYSWEYISRRHGLPLVVFTIFYVPIGLEVSAGWLADRFSKSRPVSDQDRRLWFFILLITGMVICTPKLLRYSGSDKRGYRTAAAWLRENTAQEDLIAVPDKRITFYAERKGLIYDAERTTQTEYLVIIVKNEDEKPDFAKAAQEQYSVWVDKHKKNKKLIIYKMPI
ncbi:MAG: glycosyltransferase family 39 protein [Sedimentisphaerales bacterium]